MNKLPNIDDDLFELEEIDDTPEGVDSLKPGDIVKLIFQIIIDNGISEEWSVERMWVKVKGFDKTLIIGELDNDSIVTDCLREGHKIVFEKRHIYRKHDKNSR
jgi:hypothetical protein